MTPQKKHTRNPWKNNKDFPFDNFSIHVRAQENRLRTPFINKVFGVKQEDENLCFSIIGEGVLFVSNIK